MKKVLLFILFVNITHVFGQTSQKRENVKVTYDQRIEKYALALSEILNIGVSKAKSYNYVIPEKLELRMVESDRVLIRDIRDNGGRIIIMEYDSISNFIPIEGTQFIFGGLDKLGSLVFMQIFKIKSLKKLTWMNSKFRNCWSRYFAYNFIDIIYDVTSDTVWPIPYNFKEFGTAFLDKISKNEKSPIYNEMNAWIDLGNHIGLDKFTAFFTFFKKGGCSKEAFIKSLYKFMDADAAKQWEGKYMQYIAL